MTSTAVNLAITSAGLLTSVGYDARTASAAIRARITRPKPIEECKVLDLGSGEVRPLMGHPISPITNGFVGPARWLQMAPPAFANLVRLGSLPSPEDAAFWGRCALMIVLPDLQGERFQFNERSSPERISETFMMPLRQHLPRALPAEHVLLQPLDRVALPHIIRQSGELMRMMGVDRIAILVVDSLVDPFALNWLGENGRLKSDLNPTGLMPGECAAALLLEAERPGIHDQRPTWARVVVATVGQDAASGDQDAPPRGRALAEALSPALEGGVVDLFSDLNGEPWRAREYGTALVHLGGPNLHLHHCASEVGDVGAPSSVLNTILATWSLLRRSARGARVAVAISSDNGGVGSLAIERA
ncbi:MAG: hypothetical protein KDK70_41440 [Myxococcales bacterium]|nr:hypothetical protein [Myxococcales bacterium]